MATTKDVERLPSGKLKYRGETYPGYNKPKRTPGAAKKSAVLAKKGEQVKVVRFGDPNMSIKKDNLKDVKAFGLDIIVTQPQISLLLDIGVVKHGDRFLKKSAKRKRPIQKLKKRRYLLKKERIRNEKEMKHAS